MAKDEPETVTIEYSVTGRGHKAGDREELPIVEARALIRNGQATPALKADERKLEQHEPDTPED